MTLSVFQVGVSAEDSQRLEADGRFDVKNFARPAEGESIAGRAWPSMLKIWDPKSPRASFFEFHESFLWMDDHARNVCRPALDRYGEFIAIKAETIGDVYLYNPMTTLSHDAVDWIATKNRFGTYSNLTLRKEHVPPVSIFRLPKMSGLYLSSELRDDERDFLYLYRAHGLSGLYFKKMWDERIGPVPNRTTAPGEDR